MNFAVLLFQGRNSPFVVDELLRFEVLKNVQCDSIATTNQIQLTHLGQCATRDIKHPHIEQC